MQRTSPSPSPAQQLALRSEQLRLLFDTQPFNAAATTAIAAIVAVILIPITEASRILLWCSFLVVGNLLRILITWAWRRDARRAEREQFWWRLLVLATVIVGTGWGACNWLLFPQQSLSQQMLLVFITCGISAAAAVSLAVDPRVAWSFLLPCALPLEYQLYMHASELGLALSAMGMVYLIFIAGVISRLHNYIKETLLLRLTEYEYAQALQSSQEKLRALFELSPLGCMLSHADGRFIEANQALSRMLGGGDAPSLSSVFTGRISADDQLEENRSRWQRLVQEGGVDSFECQLKRFDGTLMPASIHRMALDTSEGDRLVWSVIEDITERKRHEQQLAALNNRFALAAQGGNIGIWEVDLEHRAALWDARMCAIYGIESTSAPIPTEFVASLVHPEDWRAAMAAFRAAIEDASVERHVFEYRVILGDQSERWVRLAGLLQRDESGRVLRIIGVGWDITELKRVARMKSEFVSSVSHELRTPLTSIRGSLGLLTSGVLGELPDPVHELIDIASRNSERLVLLINDILDIEKIESGKIRLELQRLSLRSLIEQSMESNQGYAQSFSVHLRCGIDTEASVDVDANRLMQVMANLISNAVKFSSAGGTVEVVAMDTPTRVRIEVRDRGAGIPPEFRERIFQRFSQADASDTRARGGSGLGLAITRALVERMRGEVGFADRSGGGTVFFVELPRAQ